MNNDAVNHPSHYTSGKYEVIDFIECWGFGFHLGNAVKYISRAGKKDPAKIKEDLEKAIWYLRRARTLRHDQRFVDVDRNEPIGPHEYCRDKKLSNNLTIAVSQILFGNYDVAIMALQREIDGQT